MSKLLELVAVLFKMMVGSSRSFQSILVNLTLTIFALGISCALIFSGFGFIIWALHLYFTSFLQPHISALITGLVVLLIAAGLLFGVRFLTGYLLGKKKKQAPLGGAESGAMAEGRAFIRDYPGESLLSALAVGLLMGSSSEIRKALREGVISFLEQSSSEKHLKD